ncbi:MAG: hypothetical protein LBU22_01465 [Dysgonamonadaceae bacterium]|jgi:hypothetical protein|nr:hypothetical protein [Dysgonamonadaceae bacterium]
MNKKIFLYTVVLTCLVQNISAQQNFKQWAQTPPMGWNSWDCYGPTVEEHEVKANADYMAEHLKKIRMGIYRSGYSLVRGERQSGRIQPDRPRLKIEIIQ